jgi:hypothetical protein
MTRNPSNNIPEPLGTIVIVANFCLGVWNAYSNGRQEKKQSIYDEHQKEILEILRETKEKMEGEQ